MLLSQIHSAAAHIPGGGKASFIIQYQGEPGDNISAVEEGDPMLFRQVADDDALAFHAGVHPFRLPAGQTLRVGALFAGFTGLGGQDIRPHTL